MYVSEWLFNANSAIFQLYHDENKLIFNFVQDQHAELDYYSANSLKQQSASHGLVSPGMPRQAEEVLGPISIPRGSHGVGPF